jgi:hypothetical protein
MLKPDLNEATLPTIPSKTSKADREAWWADCKAQWMPYTNPDSTFYRRELVFDFERQQIRWQPVPRSTGKGARDRGGCGYRFQLLWPGGAAENTRFWSSAEGRALACTLIAGTQVITTDDGDVAVWCDDGAFRAWWTLQMSASSWVSLQNEKGRRALDEPQPIRLAIGQMANESAELWTSIETSRNCETGQLAEVHIGWVRLLSS